MTSTLRSGKGPDLRVLFGVQLGDRIDECLLFTLERARGYEPGLTSGFPSERPRAHVGNPNLNGAQSSTPQALAMSANLVAGGGLSRGCGRHDAKVTCHLPRVVIARLPDTRDNGSLKRPLSRKTRNFFDLRPSVRSRNAARRMRSRVSVARVHVARRPESRLQRSPAVPVGSGDRQRSRRAPRPSSLLVECLRPRGRCA
jgi:hypothetical protein